MVVLRRRMNVVVTLQHLLKCALCVLSLVALLSVHTRFLPSSKVPRVSDGSRELPPYEVTVQVSKIEYSWKREIVLSHSKAPFSSHKVKEIDSMEQRVKGYCPLTPKEVGILIDSIHQTHPYTLLLERYMEETLLSSKELQPFVNHASQMAALDYIVSVESDAFIPSYSGNMAREVEGHHRFLGHRKTISPDRKSLVRLFDKIDEGTMKEGKNLSIKVIELLQRRQGSPRKRKGPISGTKGMD